MTTGKDSPIDRDLRAAIESKYPLIPVDEQEKIMNDINSLLELSRDKRQSLTAILEHTARMIFRLWGFGEIAIGLMSRRDNLYRYEVFLGYRRDVEANFRKLEYALEDMLSPEAYPNIRMGKLSYFHPVEGLPEGEEYLYNRPFLLRKERKSLDEFHEGDYIDFFMYDGNKGLIGWIELARPTNGTMPPLSTVRWIELVTSVCSSIVLGKWSEEDSMQRR